MHKFVLTLGLLSILGLSACNNNTEPTPAVEPKPAEQTTPTPEPAPSTAPRTEAEKEKDGTNIRVDKNGVQIRTKDGGTVNDVKVNKDSSSVEIKRPR